MDIQHYYACEDNDDQSKKYTVRKGNIKSNDGVMPICIFPVICVLVVNTEHIATSS